MFVPCRRGSMLRGKSSYVTSNFRRRRQTARSLGALGVSALYEWPTIPTEDATSTCPRATGEDPPISFGLSSSMSRLVLTAAKRTKVCSISLCRCAADDVIQPGHSRGLTPCVRDHANRRCPGFVENSTTRGVFFTKLESPAGLAVNKTQAEQHRDSGLLPEAWPETRRHNHAGAPRHP